MKPHYVMMAWVMTVLFMLANLFLTANIAGTIPNHSSAHERAAGDSIVGVPYLEETPSDGDWLVYDSSGESWTPVAKASGEDAVASGTTSKTVTHGLSVTPTAGDCFVVGSEDPDNDVGTIWLDTYTSTTFDLNVENDPGVSNFDFAWTCLAW